MSLTPSPPPDAGAAVRGLVNTTTQTFGGNKTVDGTLSIIENSTPKKFRPGVNVMDFGAIGNGIAIDTVAINAALAAATSDGSRHVHFPPGTYRVDRGALPVAGGAIIAPSNFTFTGDGALSIIKQTGVVGTPGAYEFTVFQMEAGTKNVLFDGLSFLGENGVGSIGFTTPENNQAECIGTTVTNDITDIYVTNCIFDNLWGFSVHSQGSSERFNVTNCVTRYCANGINVNGNHSTQTGNHIFNSEGFECTGDSILLGWNTMENALGAAIALGGDTEVGKIRRGCIVVGNTIDGGTGLGIFLSDAMCEAQVVGNIVRNVYLAGFQTSDTGAVIGAKNYGNVFIGNTSVNNGAGPTKNGIILSGEGLHTASGNYCTDDGAGTQVSGIVSSSPNNTITGNTCKGVGTNGDILLLSLSTNTILHSNKLINNGLLQMVAGSSIAPHIVQGSEAATEIVEKFIAPPAVFSLFERTLTGKMSWGPGGSTLDTNLYRSAADTLKTDDSFYVAGTLSIAAGTGAGAPVVGGLLDAQSTDVGNVATGEDTLHTYTLPANSLITTNKAIRYRSIGKFANNGNAKTLKLFFGAQLISVVLPAATAGNWVGEATIFRTGISAQKYLVEIRVADSATNLVFGVFISQGALTQTETGTIVIKTTGESAATTDDLIQTLSTVEFI